MTFCGNWNMATSS